MKELFFTYVKLCLLLLFCSFPKPGQAQIIPFLIDTTLVQAPAYGDQTSPVVCTNGNDAFVVWCDNRDYENGYLRNYGARINKQLNVLDPSGIIVFGSRFTPSSVIFHGSKYLAVTPDAYNEYIYGSFISQDGVVLDTSESIITSAIIVSGPPALCWDGAHSLMTWTDARDADWNIYGALLDSNGSVIGNHILISNATNSQSGSQISFDGNNYFVVWSDTRNGNYDIYGTFISDSGSVSSPMGIKIAQKVNNQYNCAVAFDGNNYLVVWQDYRNNASESDIYGCRVAKSGAILDTANIAITRAANNQSVPAITFNGTDYIVAWADYRNGTGFSDIYYTMVDTAGSVLDTIGTAACAAPRNQWKPTLARIGDSVFIAWADERSYSSYWDIRSNLIDGNGNLADTSSVLVSTTVSRQKDAATTMTQDGYYSVWSDNRYGTWDIFGSKIDTSGQIIGTLNVVCIDTGDQVTPDIAFGANRCLSVWCDVYRLDENSWKFKIRAKLMNLGMAGTDTIIDIGNGWQPSVAFDGCNFMVAWGDNNSVKCLRLDTLGNRIDVSPFLISDNKDNRSISIVYGNGMYFLTWSQNCDNIMPFGAGQIWGARILPTGQVLDTASIAIAYIADYEYGNPTVTSDGTHFLVGWEEEWQTVSALIDTAGNVIGIHNIYNGGQHLSIVYDGNYYMAAWGGGDIGAIRIDNNGNAKTPFIISTQPGIHDYPVIAHKNDNSLVLYEGWADTAGGKTFYTNRIWAAFIDDAMGVQINNPIDKTNISLHLRQNTPNPWNHETTIDYNLPRECFVSLNIYNLLGQKVATLVNKPQIAGEYSAVWKGCDISNKRVSPGIYIYRLNAGGHSLTRKMIKIN